MSNQVQSERRIHQFALARAIADENETAINELDLPGYPMGRGHLHLNVARVRRWARFYGFLRSRMDDGGRTQGRLMGTPEYGVMDIYRFLKGTLVSTAKLGRVMLTDSEA